MNLALRFRETLERVHPALVSEFDAVIASILAGWSREHGSDDRHRRVSLEAIRSLDPTETPIEVLSGLRYLRGPWILEEDGDVAGHAVLRPPALTADAHNYAPQGFRDAIVLELDATTDVAITGLHIGVQAGGRRKRLLVLVNRSNYTITLKHDHGDSQTQHRFYISGYAGDYPMAPGESVWLYYDTTSQRWRPFGSAGSVLGAPSVGSTIPQFARKVSIWYFADFGNNIRTNGNSLTVSGTVATIARSDGWWQSRTSGAVAGNMAGWQNVNVVQPQMNPSAVAIIRTTANISNCRIWVGLGDRQPANAESPAAGVGGFAIFRYSSAVETTWKAVLSDGAGTPNYSEADLGVPVSANTAYRLRVRRTSSGWGFSINDGPETVLTSHAPGSTANMGFQVVMYTTEAVAKTLELKRMVVEYGA